jgi:hypothetical protein
VTAEHQARAAKLRRIRPEPDWNAIRGIMGLAPICRLVLRCSLMRPVFLVLAFGVLGAGVAGFLTHGADQHAVSLGAIAGVLVGLLVDLAFHIGDRMPAGSA